MIRPIDIRLNAAHPELKLPESVTYTGSPSTVLIRGVPPNCGRWAITAVSVAATFPDGSTTTRAAVQSANGVWVATLPGTATSGRTTDGFRVIADGIDENGEAATGYILAVADFAVASLDVTPAPQPGETSYQMLYFDAVPSVLRKGDVTKIDGVLKFYNGEAWEAFATPPTLDDAVTRTSANGVKSSGIWSAIWGALSALPTGFSSLYDWVVDRLAAKLDANSGTMTGRFNLNGILNVNYSGGTAYEIDYYGIRVHYSGGVTKQIFMPYIVSYADGSGSMALVNNLAPDFSTSTTYYKDDLVKYNGALFICTATSHTGAWSASDFAVAPVQTALASKLGHEGPWVNGYIDVLERVTGESVPYGVRIYRDKIVYGAFTNATPRDFTPIREFALPSAGGTLALTAGTGHTGNLAALDANGNPTDAGWTAGDLARYSLVAKTIANGAVTLDDRASNSVTISATLSPNTLTINFPTAPTGKLRDFSMRLNIAAGVTAPEIAWPQGVTLENNDGEVPEIGADGAATILYFTETASGVFLVKGEVLQTITQA